MPRPACQHCGRPISLVVRSCPQCGSRQVRRGRQSTLASLIVAAGLFVVFAGCTLALTPSRSEVVMHGQLFVDLLAAVAVVIACGAIRTPSR
jgi:hypothetical protein